MAEQTKKKKLTKQGRKYAINITVMVVVTAVAFYFILKDNPGQVIRNLSNCDLKYIFIALGIMLGFYLVESLILTVLAKMYKRNYRFHKGFLNCMIGAFFRELRRAIRADSSFRRIRFPNRGSK